MTDRELLEAAARAAGYKNPLYGELSGDAPVLYVPCIGVWDPLTDDGDALRLAVKLELQIDMRHSFHTVRVYGAAEGRIDEGAKDPYAATRRAIVRAAAAMAPTGKHLLQAPKTSAP